MRKSTLILWTMVCMSGLAALSPSIRPAAAQYRNPAISDTAGATYWMDRGAMLSTYGNHSAAIKAYQKAIFLEPNRSAIYYNMGLSYGESGRLDQAMEMMNKALSLEPGNAHFLYGRGWVLLRAGKVREAQADLEKAAQAGDRDAQLYLKQQ
jgi:tetratricopeptide (TPR) repeat protein